MNFSNNTSGGFGIRLFLRIGIVCAALGGVGVTALTVAVVGPEIASEYPEYSWLVTPYRFFACAVAACGLVVLVGIWRLLDFVSAKKIFEPRSRAYVWMVIWSLLVAGLACFVIILITGFGTGQQQPGMFLMLLALWGCCWLAAALMWVMLQLLNQATEMNDELAGVI
ncbi:DUF2975 domain-containing protein [Propionimicrobium lymphophilum]|uniref:DUF2975 domain-containing protein n=1 Tax=Propionimicrobium lymphophilum TaxID=33012 RepID=UPI0023F4CFF2|nr:DUF2975 domain-containing protein [Propionimicrobium lymphophilum]